MIDSLVNEVITALFGLLVVLGIAAAAFTIVTASLILVTKDR